MLTPLAIELNKTLAGTTPGELLSDLGARLYFPKGIIAQSAEAKKLGISGVTVTAAQSGYGRDGKLHSAHFFELAEQPVEVTMAVAAEKSDLLFAKIAEERLKIFYVKTPIEFGVTGEE